MNKLIIVSSTITLILSGCANLTSPAREHALDSNTSYWFDYDVSRRGAVMVPNNANIKICSEPSPDVALTLFSKLDASAEQTGVGKIGGSADFNASVVKLVERTQMVMFLRESLYRLCEQSMNNKFTSSEVLNAYNNVISGALEIVKTDRINAEKDNAKAKEATIKALKSLTDDQVKALQ